VDAAGSLVLAEGSVHASRPVADSFAIVEVDTAEAVRVYLDNREVGTARAGRPLVVPSLVSYDSNRISIDDRDVRVDYRVADTTRSVTTGWRGGGVVRFQAVRIQAFVGRLGWVEDGRRSPADYARLELALPDRSVVSAVGKHGEFYLENLPRGGHSGRLLLNGRECTFRIDVPVSEAMVVDLGEVECAAR
jgi:outer membrane usher protein